MFNYLSNLIFYTLFGTLLGVIKSWNKKVYYTIWIIGLILVVVAGFFSGANNLASDLAWYQFAYNIIFMVVGLLLGEITYKNMTEVDRR